MGFYPKAGVCLIMGRSIRVVVASATAFLLVALAVLAVGVHHDPMIPAPPISPVRHGYDTEHHDTGVTGPHGRAHVLSVGAHPRSVPDDGTSPLWIYVSVFSNQSEVTGIQVDLTPIGGSVEQHLYDDGTGGDLARGDGNFTFRTVVTPQTQPGEKDLYYVVRLSADNSHSIMGHISMMVPNMAPVVESANAYDLRGNPTDTVGAGSTTEMVMVAQIHDENGPEDVERVWVEITHPGDTRKEQVFLYDEGRDGDDQEGDGVYSRYVSVRPDEQGTISWTVHVEDKGGAKGSLGETITVDPATSGDDGKMMIFIVIVGVLLVVALFGVVFWKGGRVGSDGGKAADGSAQDPSSKGSDEDDIQLIRMG
jgi:uncharacterized protein YrzB (UPF0473 family)